MKQNRGHYKISPYDFHRIIKWINIDVTMGGAKKKSIGSQERTSKDTSTADEKTKKGEKKGPIKQKQKSTNKFTEYMRC